MNQLIEVLVNEFTLQVNPDGSTTTTKTGTQLFHHTGVLPAPRKLGVGICISGRTQGNRLAAVFADILSHRLFQGRLFE